MTTTMNDNDNENDNVCLHGAETVQVHLTNVINALEAQFHLQGAAKKVAP